MLSADPFLYNIAIRFKELQKGQRETLLHPSASKGPSRIEIHQFQIMPVRQASCFQPADFEGILKNKKMKIEPGDALLIYTGYSKLWMSDNARYLDLQPGPGKRAAQWIADKKVGITGADTASFDVVTPGTKELFPCHQVLITDHGIQLVENMKLDELALSGIDEFLFVMAPLKLKGGAGSPVAPFAVL